MKELLKLTSVFGLGFVAGVIAKKHRSNSELEMYRVPDDEAKQLLLDLLGDTKSKD